VQEEAPAPPTPARWWRRLVKWWSADTD
jgi:hypothetical protein